MSDGSKTCSACGRRDGTHVDDCRNVERAALKELRDTVMVVHPTDQALKMAHAVAFRPERVHVVTAGSEANWTVNDIRIDNAVSIPTDEERARMKESDERRAKNHTPTIVRTLIDGPGNRSRIVGCGCRASGIHDAATWAEHVGMTNNAGAIVMSLAIEDAWRDVIDYPSLDTMANLRHALDNARCRCDEVDDTTDPPSAVRCPQHDVTP